LDSEAVSDTALCDGLCVGRRSGLTSVNVVASAGAESDTTTHRNITNFPTWCPSGESTVNR
jgi:hypothetical protein